MATAFVNEAAESAVLYVILTTPSKQADVIAQLSSDDFYKPEYKMIFSVIQAMYLEKKEIDLVTLSAAMNVKYGAQEKNLTILATELLSGFFDTWATNDHIKAVKSCSLRRNFWKILNSAQKELEDDSNDTSAVLEKVRQQLRDVVVTKHSWKSIGDVISETYEELEKKSRGEELSMPSGIAEMDAATTGFHPGELTIIGARPAVGKSALGAQIALSTARNGYKVGIVSREMTAVQYGTRILANGSEVDAKKLRTGQLDPEDWVQIARVIPLYTSANINFLFTAKYVEDIRMEVQKLVDSGKLDMLVIDYVQLLQTRQKFDKDYLRIAYISKMLKDMTTDFRISIIGLAQVNRSSENTMPTLAELRGSGDLEQDADNVIFMHRPKDSSDMYVRPKDRPIFQMLKDSGLQYMVLKIAKQRQGETGSIATVFNPARMRFTMIQPDDYPQQTSMLPPAQDEDDED